MRVAGECGGGVGAAAGWGGAGRWLRGCGVARLLAAGLLGCGVVRLWGCEVVGRVVGC